MQGLAKILQKTLRQVSLAAADRAFDLLPLIPSFFLVASAAAFAAKVLPPVLAFAAPLGLMLSYLMGPAGFVASLAVLIAAMFFFLSSLSLQLHYAVYFGSTLVSWWLASLCSEHYQQRLGDLKDMISTLFKKNLELETHAKNVTYSLSEERKHLDKQRQEWQGRVSELEEQLAGYKHHLSLSWQEASDLKEEMKKQRESAEDKLQAAESISLLHLQQKQHAEALFLQEKQAHGILLADCEKKHNDFLEEFSFLKQRIAELEAALSAKEKAVSTAQNTLCPDVDAGRDLKLLREQFQQKSLVLENTRRQLFLQEQQLMSMERACQESILLEEGSALEELIKEYCSLARYCEHLEEEIALLEGLVMQGMPPRKEQKKKSSAPAVYDLLDHAGSLFDLG